MSKFLTEMRTSEYMKTTIGDYMIKCEYMSKINYNYSKNQVKQSLSDYFHNLILLTVFTDSI